MQFEVLRAQRWARLRKTIIRTFHPKRMNWCLEVYLYPGGARYEWVRVANPQSGLRMSKYKVTILRRPPKKPTMISADRYLTFYRCLEVITARFPVTLGDSIVVHSREMSKLKEEIEGSKDDVRGTMMTFTCKGIQEELRTRWDTQGLATQERREGDILLGRQGHSNIGKQRKLD
jgi:hypothetical protein